MKVVLSYFLFTAYFKTTWCYKPLKTKPFPSFIEGNIFSRILLMLHTFIMNVDDQTAFSMIANTYL